MFNGTELKVGHKLVSINKKKCCGMSKMDVIGLLKEAQGEIAVVAEDTGSVGALSMRGPGSSSVGSATMATSVATAVPRAAPATKVNPSVDKAGLIRVMARKPSATAKLGLGLKPVEGSIVISTIGEGSLFSGTDLKVGQKLVSINQESCGNMSVHSAIALLKEAEGDIAVTAEDIGVVGVTVVKKSANARLGIGLKSVSKDIVISSIADDGLFISTDLRVGHKLISINRTNVKGLTTSEAVSMIKNAEGELTLMAMP